MVLAIAGLVLSLTVPAKNSWMSVVTGALSAAALIGLFIQIKSEVKSSTKIPTAGDDNDLLGLNKLSQQMDKVAITVDFTPWFYVAVIAFLAAAFFSYKPAIQRVISFYITVVY